MVRYKRVSDRDIANFFAERGLRRAMDLQGSSCIRNFGRDARELLSDFIAFGFGRKSSVGQVPDPFALPGNPPGDFFFRYEMDRATFAGLN